MNLKSMTQPEIGAVLKNWDNLPSVQSRSIPGSIRVSVPTTR